MIEPSKPLRCFIDSNIWLYALIETDAAPEKTQRAKAAIGRHEIILSTQVINEVCVNLRRKVALSEDRLRGLIADFYAKYMVVEIDRSILIRASYLRERHHFSFWDSLIVASALQVNANIVYSEDMHDGLRIEEKLLIKNPLKIMNIET